MPSTAVRTALTTPPKRVAMPPASTTCATSPRSSASSPAARALSYRASPVVGSFVMSSSRGGSIEPWTTFEAGESSPAATCARRDSKRGSSNPKRSRTAAVSRSTSITIRCAEASEARTRTARDGRPLR